MASSRSFGPLLATVLLTVISATYAFDTPCFETECGGSCPSGTTKLTTKLSDANGRNNCSPSNPRAYCCPSAVAPDPKRCRWAANDPSGFPRTIYQCFGKCGIDEVLMTRDTYGDGSFQDGLGHAVTCKYDTQAFCCGGIVPHGASTANCAWYGSVPKCDDNRCPDNKINVKNDHSGDSSTSCNAAILRAQCCDHPSNLPFYQAHTPPHSSSKSSSPVSRSSTRTTKSSSTPTSSERTSTSSKTSSRTSTHSMPPSKSSSISSKTSSHTSAHSTSASKSSSISSKTSSRTSAHSTSLSKSSSISSKTSSRTSVHSTSASKSSSTSSKTSSHSSGPSTVQSVTSTKSRSQTTSQVPTATPTANPQDLTDEAQKLVNEANNKAKAFSNHPDEGSAKDLQSAVKKAAKAAKTAQDAANAAKDMADLAKSLGNLVDSLAKAETAVDAAVAAPSAATAAAAASAVAAAAAAAEAAHQAAKPTAGPSKPATTAPPTTMSTMSTRTSSSSSSSSSGCPYCVSCADDTLQIEQDPSADSGDSPADAPEDPTPNEGSNPEDAGPSTAPNSTVLVSSHLQKRASRVRKQVFVCDSKKPINGPIYTQGNSGKNFRSYGYTYNSGQCSQWKFELVQGAAGATSPRTVGGSYATEHIYEAQLIDTFLRQIAQKKVDNFASKPVPKACKDVIGGTVLLNGKFPGVSTKGNPGVFDGKMRPIVELAENLSGDDRLLNGQSEMVFLAENLNGIKLQIFNRKNLNGIGIPQTPAKILAEVTRVVLVFDYMNRPEIIAIYQAVSKRMHQTLEKLDLTIAQSRLTRKFDNPTWADAYRAWEKEFLDSRAAVFKTWKNAAITKALEALDVEDSRNGKTSTRNAFRKAIEDQKLTGSSDAHFTFASLYAWV